MLNESKKIGVKIFVNLNNIEKTIKKPLNPNIVNEIVDKENRKKVVELFDRYGKIFAWAAMIKVREQLRFEDTVIFVVEKSQDIFILTYIDYIFDRTEEIKKAVGWKEGKEIRGYQDVVFFKDKIEATITISQIEEIKKITGIIKKSNGQYTHAVLSEKNKIEELMKIINRYH